MDAVLTRYGCEPLKDGKDYYGIFHHYWRWRAPQPVKELIHGLEVSMNNIL